MLGSGLWSVLGSVVVEGVVVVVVWVCFWRCCWGSFVGSVWWYGVVWCCGGVLVLVVLGAFCVLWCWLVLLL